jgi:peptidyl-dipeptidase A
MTRSRPFQQAVRLLAAAAIGALALAPAACQRDATPAGTAASVAPADEDADAFIARVNREMQAGYAELSAAQWVSSTYINHDSELLAAKANERWLAQIDGWIDQSRRFEGRPMKPETARALSLLKQMSPMPPPRDEAKRAELTRIATRLEGQYGAARYCTDGSRTGEGDARHCRTLGELEDVLRTSRDYDAQLDAWRGWHSVAAPMREDYARFVALVDEGARDMGFADAGEAWRAGYDMPPAQFAAETDRLWGQVKPLYEQLHCYARARLQARYGVERGALPGNLLPAHLLGNMWQQDWSNLRDLLAPYPEARGLDVTAALQARFRADRDAALADAGEHPTPEAAADALHTARMDSALRMARRAESFYTSLGMPALPDSYWQRSQFIRPRDRDVVCHASAWDMDMQGDVRTKTCTAPTEEDFTTLYHELGHVYYTLAYNKLTPIFQAGANDGFHEAIGDTIVLSMTPAYLHSIGLAGEPGRSHEALIDAQMRMALAKVAFLPFGLAVDRWRWGVFDGSIPPSRYNRAWWDLKARYQGVAPVEARGEDQFDPGAKYHVPANTPYTRYFLADILQFQFYKALCDAAGFKGPLNECDFHGNAAAGRKYRAMLAAGASQPWQDTLRQFAGTDRMDASAMLEYFAPLEAWLAEENAGRSCGWTEPTALATDPGRTLGSGGPRGDGQGDKQ